MNLAILYNEAETTLNIVWFFSFIYKNIKKPYTNKQS